MIDWYLELYKNDQSWAIYLVYCLVGLVVSLGFVAGINTTAEKYRNGIFSAVHVLLVVIAAATVWPIIALGAMISIFVYASNIEVEN